MVHRDATQRIVIFPSQEATETPSTIWGIVVQGTFGLVEVFRVTADFPLNRRFALHEILHLVVYTHHNYFRANKVTIDKDDKTMLNSVREYKAKNGHMQELAWKLIKLQVDSDVTTTLQPVHTGDNAE